MTLESFRLFGMAAPLGNQFWKQRSTHGRDALFATPELLWEAAAEYFEWCDANPWIKVEQLKKPTATNEQSTTGKGADKVVTKTQKLHYIAELPTARPYTLRGFMLYVDASESYLRKFKETATEGFFTVITRIEEIIYTQKFEGAVVGAFNANIISRDLGLVDKSESKIRATVQSTPFLVIDPDNTGQILDLDIGADK